METERPDPRVETYVLYHTPDGDKYHRKVACATKAAIPPALDAANSAFQNVEMTRVEDADPERGELCDNCATRVRKNL